MAWFRAGGAGIPASLKSGMNDVLNKKFGTSTTYPPSDWPSDVNLLGPLPEKTASGAIASFSDGADTVPLKSLVFGITPSGGGGTPQNPVPIVGVTELTGFHTGKNLLNFGDFSNSYRITSVTDNGDGSFTVVGSDAGAYIDHVIPVKAGITYCIKAESATNDEGNASQLSLCDVFDGETSATKLINGGSIISSRKTFTPTGTIVTVRNRVTGGSGGGTGTMTKPQLEVGNQATTYAPYSAESKRWEFGQTVYGGELDAVNGKLTTYASYDMGDLSWTRVQYQSSGIYGFRHIPTDKKNGAFNLLAEGYALATSGHGWGNNMENLTIVGQTNTAYIFVRDDNYSTSEDFTTAVRGKKLIYEQATPTEIDVDSVNWNSKYADNNFYCDTGDTSCEYRADIALALGN